MHQKKASTMFQLHRFEEEDDSPDINKIANTIKKEMKGVPKMKEEYPVLNSEEISKCILPTISELLTSISPKFSSNEKVMALISSIIVSTATQKTNMLQVALGVLIKEKKLIQHLYEYGVCVSYDEVRRFNTSAATSDDSKTKLNSKSGLIQGISDDFDANPITQNG